jgi:hypothetical protein
MTQSDGTPEITATYKNSPWSRFGEVLTDKSGCISEFRPSNSRGQEAVIRGLIKSRLI